MAWYYSASERAFFSSDLMTTGSMPSDKVAVTDSDYEDLMDDQVSGLLIRPGSGNAPESASQNLTTASRFGDVSFGKVTATGLDLNGNADVSGTLVVTGASTLKGALAAQGGLTTTTITATGTSTLAAVNATNITASGTLKVNGASTLKAVSATNVTASGTLAVTGTSTFTGKVTANGGLTTKALTATSLDLNGAGDVSGNLNVGGLLTVTGEITAKSAITTTNNDGFRLVDDRQDALTLPSNELSDWPIRVVDANTRTIAMLKYVRGTSGETSWLFTDVTYSESGGSVSQDWSQLAIGHRADGTRYCETAAPFAAKGGLAVSGGSLTSSGAVSFSNGLSVSGDVNCTSAFRSKANTSFVHEDTAIDVNSNPSSNQQRWPLAIYDKNENALAYCKFTKGTDGTKQWAFVVAHPKSDGSGNNLGGFSANCDANGKFSTIGVTPDDDSNSQDLATTQWVRRYIGDTSDSKVVHTVNDETISGSKTFTYAIRGGATTLIQSVPWEGISIADSSRESTVNRMMAVILDKDSKRFAGLEAAATSSGQRYVHISMRRRDDSGWVSPFKAVELPDGTTYCEGSHHPPAGDNSYKLATTGWVVSQLSTSGEETHICPIDQAVVFKRSGTHICGSVHVQMYRDWDSEGQKSDTYGLYRGSTKIAEVTVTCETNVTGGSGHGRDADITLVGYFETDASIPAGSSLTLKRDVAGIDCITFRVAFAHVTVSNA